MRTLSTALVTGGAATLSLGLWTFRMALANRGRRLLSAVFAGVEALLYVSVFTSLVAGVGDPVRLVAYATGVAVGTLLGLHADERLTAGVAEVRAVAAGDGTAVLDLLHRAGWPATGVPGVGPRGPVTSISLAVDERHAPEVLGLLENLQPAPFVSVERLRRTRASEVPDGFVQIGAGRRGATRAPRAVGRRAVRIRALCADERVTLDRVFLGLSVESRQRRFLGAVDRLSPSLRESLSRVDGTRHVALVAEVRHGRGWVPVGIGRYAVDAPGTAELAFEVVDAWQGRGIGRRLVAALVAQARAAGLQTLHASVLADNEASLRVLRRVLPQLRVDDTGGVLEVVADLVDRPLDAPSLLAELA
ncbi:GNAT family N-acetyltransferase [Egicoccus sp. AB-alg2]|uniref:GNAT family N-acetyltransferase n=1 Tax=Egicoccus sp. AB-alg2 TaxID=3242693 RepID=UPI00359D8E63